MFNRTIAPIVNFSCFSNMSSIYFMVSYGTFKITGSKSIYLYPQMMIFMGNEIPARKKVYSNRSKCTDLDRH